MGAPSIRVNVGVPFPSRVIGKGGLSVSKQNGIYTISLAFDNLVNFVPPTLQWPTVQIAYLNETTKAYGTISLQDLYNSINQTNSKQIITAAGAVAVSSTDSLIVLNKAAPSATAISLPAVASRANSLPLDIYDFKGNGGDITITPNGTELIMGVNQPWIVGSGGAVGTGGRVTLTPSTDVGGWLVK